MADKQTILNNLLTSLERLSDHYSKLELNGLNPADRQTVLNDIGTIQTKLEQIIGTQDSLTSSEIEALRQEYQALVDNLTTSSISQEQLDFLLSKNHPSFSFIFDDGYISHLDVIKPLFDDYNLKCGFAITLNFLEQSNKMNFNNLQSLVDSGYELLSHSMNHIRFDSSVNTFISDNEFSQSRDLLDNLSPCNGFVAPYSAITSEHLSNVNKNYKYAFTSFKSNTVLPSDIVLNSSDNVTSLWRLSLDAVSNDYIFESVNEAIRQNGTIVFYQHDVLLGSPEYDKLVYTLDLLKSLNCIVSLPSQSINKKMPFNSVSSRSNFGSLPDYSINNFSSSQPTKASLTVDTSLKKIVCTCIEPFLTMFSNYFYINSDYYGKTLTFEYSVSISSQLGSSNKIGMKFRTSSGVDIEAKEEVIGSFDGLYRKYQVSMSVPRDVSRILLFFRLDFVEVGQVVELLDPKIFIGRKST